MSIYCKMIFLKKWLNDYIHASMKKEKKVKNEWNDYTVHACTCQKTGMYIW